MKIALEFYQPDTVTPVFVGDIRPFVIADNKVANHVVCLIRFTDFTNQ